MVHVDATMSILDSARKTGGALYQQADVRLRGAPRTMGNAFRTFNEECGGESAASLAYYGLFALFPLLLVVIAVGTLFLGGKRAEEELVDLLTQYLPGSQLVVQQNLMNVMQQRGTVTWIGLIVLIWSASGFFIALTRSLRRAWPGGKALNMIQLRLSGLLVVVALGLLFVLWSAMNLVLNTLPLLFPNLPGVDLLREGMARVLPALVVFPMLIVLYRWTGRPMRGLRGIVIAAAVAALALQALVLVFGWYLGSGLMNYELIYGSIAGVIGLLLFVYFLSFIVLFGAHLAAAIDLRLVSITPATPAPANRASVEAAPAADANQGEGI
jgi:membrane protein